MENQFFIDAESLSESALAKKHQLENDPSSRKDHMEYLPGMEVIESDVRDKVMSQVNAFDYSGYTAKDVKTALEHETCSIEDFKALLSPAAEPFLEQMAQRARRETSKHFGNTVYLFTPLYIANYCENYCVYCGFNCYNDIHRMKLSMEQIEKEMKVIADSGMEEILILTGESRGQSDVKYIGEACRLARKYFRMVGLEIYPVNTDEYRYLHECGADYVTVFQETYDADKYETLHLLGHKRVWPYRFDAQERALRGGMRGVAFSALLGLSDFRKDALASALHVYFLQRKYPHYLVQDFVRSSIMIRSIRWMFMKSSFVRSFVHTVFFCRLWESLFHPERAPHSAMALSRLPQQRFLPAFPPELAITKANTTERSRREHRAMSSLRSTITGVLTRCIGTSREVVCSRC